MKSQSRSSPNEVHRLNSEDWTRAAIKRLASNGIDGVRVELLAKDLGVTKGSFYWHFKDRDALYESMLESWRRRATLALIERLDSSESGAEQRFRRLLRVPITSQNAPEAANVELAIRLWAKRDPRAHRALEEVDTLRLQYISGLLAACGLSEQSAKSRAVLAYCYMRVGATLIPKDAFDFMKSCEDALLGPEGFTL